ncbi:MAG TPA: hypothetical protein DCY07_05290 [Rhodospirillaceae bacterium]|nr:hypothetical protein [Rhodospirillaceae bacterium]
MFLFVYIFLLMSVLGLFTNVYMLRTARMAENQTAIAESMMVWHGAAYKMAMEKGAAILPGGAVSCYITPTTVLHPLPMAPETTVPCAFRLTSVPLSTYFPKNYSVDDEYKFLSKVYTAGGIRYLVTYIRSDQPRLGYTSTQLSMQMRNAKFPLASYGTVSATSGCTGVAAPSLMTKHKDGANQVCYPVRDSVPLQQIPNGAVGIVSIL